MPRVVLIAKTTYVWLDQLSRAVRPPDLAARPDPGRGARPPRAARLHRPVAHRPVGAQPGVADDQADARQPGGRRVGLLADGLPHRRRPRRRRGLREPPRPRVARGIRLASDMVPNHMGIDSRWVIEHPDWFIDAREPPYPGYSLQRARPVGRSARRHLIEDHYFDNTDAAVVVPARRPLDAARSATSTTATTAPACRGTTPRSSTTSSAEVREAVIQTILHVARQFPIIRFDAAMTLAKRHIAAALVPRAGQRRRASRRAPSTR